MFRLGSSIETVRSKMVKHEKARYVYVMVSYDKGQYFGSLLEVKLDGKKQQSSSPILLKPVALFKAKELSIPVVWQFCTFGSALPTYIYCQIVVLTRYGTLNSPR